MTKTKILRNGSVDADPFCQYKYVMSEEKQLQKQIDDLAAQVRGVQRALQVLQNAVQQLKQENRHLKARVEAQNHTITNVARMLRKDT